MHSRQVICIDTGVIYKSVTEAQKQVAESIWYNLKFGVPYKGKRYQYYNPKEKKEKPVKTGIKDYELCWIHYLKAFHNQHPEYNKVTRTMTAKEYADYLKERKIKNEARTNMGTY